jgi:phage-related protein
MGSPWVGDVKREGVAELLDLDSKVKLVYISKEDLEADMKNNQLN